ncbi:phenylalanine--tRNA ligase subunit beta [Candidatus Dependentiae bacterium]
MKISVAWIFDHIDADWQKIDIAQLVDKFNRTTAEIEGVDNVSMDPDSMSLVEVVSLGADAVTVSSPELKKEMTLTPRKDAQKGQFFLIKKDGKDYRWISLVDLGCGKDGLLPALYVDEVMRAGGWKKSFEAQDYILEIDNKSITHRPDMWSHRGFAREVAAILNLSLVPLENITVQKEVKAFDNHAPSSPDSPIEISLKDQKVGKRFAGLYCGSVQNRPSSLRVALRLARTGNRPINALIDATNFVMLDVGQPMHAFDASVLKTVEARLAKKGEKLTTLDDQEIELTTNDFVITDGKKPISLAGVMGGKESGISDTTTAIFLESANFDATTIRRTASRHKIRTESSARFEKTLDPNQNVTAILRFLKHLTDEGVAYDSAPFIASLGKETAPLQVAIKHDFICSKLGVALDPSFVSNTLQRLAFEVVQSGKDDAVEYQVTVPTLRCTKDVTIKEDIVEEVGRFFGYDNLELVLPKRAVEPSDLTPVMRVRNMKQLLAHSVNMREVYNYALYDESFLQSINLEVGDCVRIQNPVSENWQRLTTSLIPHLLKNVQQNSTDHDRLRFFEWGRTWKRGNGSVLESKSLAGIIFVKKCVIDFYEAKDMLERLFNLLALPVSWKKAGKSVPSWFAPYQTAKLVHNGNSLGWAGKVDSALLASITEGEAFIFELDGDELLAHKEQEKQYVPTSKYPGVHRDVSMLVSLEVTVQQIVMEVRATDERVRDVRLVDFFQKEEWQDKKSVTIRFIIQDEEKTLTSEEADQVSVKIAKQLERLGANIR